MANDKTKNDKTDLTIEERLKALYQLQTLLSKIDEIPIYSIAIQLWL